MGYSILVVDDIRMNRSLISAILRKKIDDIQILEAVDGFEAIECINKENVDLIILDLMMPRMDGFETLKILKDNHLTKDIPIIVNSALNDMENIKKALSLGAYEYFTKPLTSDQINILLPMKVINAISSYKTKKKLIDINERMNEELKIASILQKTIVKKKKIFEIGTMYGELIPSTFVSGDFYDCVQIEDSLWFVIADVTGHGVAAAMISSMIKVAFFNAINMYKEPNEVLSYINDIFTNINKENFEKSKYPIMFTTFIGVVRDNKLLYSNAGHPYPFIFNTYKKTVKMIQTNGFFIGSVDDPEYDVDIIEVDKNSVILLYSDGIFEFIKNRISGWLQLYEHCSFHIDYYIDAFINKPEKLIETILKDIYDKEKVLKDDIAIMFIDLK